jgi:TolB-like protein/Tfp pilus assembly protein PilF
MPAAADALSDDRLDSWKEIAAHLKRSVSTVQRWEQQEGLPVRRHPHGKLGSVYASRTEVDAWWEATKVVLSRRNGAAERGQEQGAPTVVSATRRVTRKWLWASAAFLVVAAVAGAWVSRRSTGEADAATPAIGSLVVLPLKDIGASAGDGWFVEGVTDAIRMALSETGRVTVIAGTSSRLYENTPKRTRDICRELGVDAVLEGTVHRDRGRVRVNVALVEGRTERRLRAVSSEREPGDVLDLFADVARQITAGLDPAFGTKERPSRAVNPEAYDAYLRGQYLRNRRQAGGCVRAEPYLKEAIRLDPALAEAHADLAFCYGFDHLSETLSAQEGAALGRAEAERALALEERLPRAHVALGLLRHRFDYDWAGAERSLKRAVELNPNQVDALAFYAELLYLSGRRDEGLAMFRHAAAVDPFHPDHNVGFAFALLNLGLLDESVRQFRKALDLEPGSILARFWLAETLAAQGRRDEAVVEYLAFLGGSLAPAGAAAVTEALKRTYAGRGWIAFWRAELALAEEDAASSGTLWNFPVRTRQPYQVARRHARLGETAQALAALAQACEQRAYMVVFLATDPVFAPLRQDPRFQALVRRIGLPSPASR